LLSVHASSSIFLVIIALWAAYLVPGAIKRRRRTASARIADRDSAALRVVVRRAGTASAAAGEVTTAGVLEPSSRPVLGATSTTPALPAAGGARPAGTPAPVATGAVAPAGRRGADVVRRRRRLVLLLLALSVAGAAAGALGLVPVLPALLPSLALLLVLGALARHGASRTAAPVVVAHAAPLVTSAPAAAPAPASAAVEPVEVTTVLPAQREPAAVASAAADGSWDPVAVPLPTYLLKPKAPERPRTAPVPAVAVHVEETPTVLIDLREGARAVNE